MINGFKKSKESKNLSNSIYAQNISPKVKRLTEKINDCKPSNYLFYREKNEK